MFMCEDETLLGNNGRHQQTMKQNERALFSMLRQQCIETRDRNGRNRFTRGVSEFWQVAVPAYQ